MSFIEMLVLRCGDVAKTRAFYECLELEFEEHRHGNGPLHSTAMDQSGSFLELYPASEKHPVDRSGIGFGAPNLERIIAALTAKAFTPGAIEEQSWGKSFVVRDPDNRRVEVRFQLSDGDPEFEEELKQRLEEIDKGNEKSIPWEESIKRLEQQLENFVPPTTDRWVEDS